MTHPKPTNISRAALDHSPRAVPMPTAPSMWWGGGLVVLGLVCAPLLWIDAGSRAIAHLPWILATWVAAMAWGRAALQAEGRTRLGFWAMGIGAFLTLAAYLYGAYAATPLLSASPALAGPSVLPYLAMAAGAILILGARKGRVWISRLAADALLLVLVALAAALRLFVEPLLVASGPSPETLLLTLSQTASIIPAVFAALVVLRRESLLSAWAATLLLLGTSSLAIGDLLASTTASLPAPIPRNGATLSGWVLLAASGMSALQFPSTVPAMLAWRRIPDLLRKLIVPGAALFLAVAVVDISLGREPRPETVGAVALLAALLAIRSGWAFSLVDRDADRLRQIAFTRTLVDVTHALAGAKDLDETLRIISESAREVFGTRGAGIELVVEDGTSLETRSAVGLPDTVLGLRFPVDGSFTGWVVRHEQPRATADPSRDPYIQPQSLSFLGRSPVAAAPIQFRGETLGALYACIRAEPFGAEELELMGAMAEQAAIAIQQARLFEQVTKLSLTDPLTGLSNRRGLQTELAREFAAARRGRHLAVAILDLDRFKDYNDTFGHVAGDELLHRLGDALKRETRAMNVTARYGGDEFVAVLSGGDESGARRFVERVEARFEKVVKDIGNGPLTFSAGIAVYSPDMEEPEDLLRAADASLYRAKPAYVAWGTE